jgi:hypothetical protein
MGSGSPSGAVSAAQGFCHGDVSQTQMDGMNSRVPNGWS